MTLGLYLCCYLLGLTWVRGLRHQVLGLGLGCQVLVNITGGNAEQGNDRRLQSSCSSREKKQTLESVNLPPRRRVTGARCLRSAKHVFTSCLLLSLSLSLSLSLCVCVCVCVCLEEQRIRLACLYDYRIAGEREHCRADAGIHRRML